MHILKMNAPVVTFQIGYSSVFITGGDLCHSINSKASPVVTLHKSGQFSQLNCTRNFRHRNISARGHFGTVAQVPKCLYQNVHIALQGAKISMCRNVQVPKYPCAKMFMYRKFLVLKIPHAKNSPCRNVRVLKSTSARTSAAPNSACAEMFP